MTFAGISFEQLQLFALPLIKALGGPDIGQEMEDKADVLLESGNLLIDAGAVLHAAASAMEDGILTDEEIDVASQPPGIAFVAAILIFMR